MQLFERAIIIDEPWVSKIVRGDKIWELRSKRTRFRGSVALIRKGSGTVVGTARLVDCLPPLSLSELARYEQQHAIPRVEHREAFDLGRVIPWVLSEAKALTPGVPYSHPSGQQIWVRLDSEVDRAIQAAWGSCNQRRYSELCCSCR